MLSWVMSVSVCLLYETIYHKPFSDTKHLCVMLYGTPCTFVHERLLLWCNSEHILSHGRSIYIILGLQKMYFQCESQWNKYNMNWKNLSLLFFGSSVNRSDSKHLSWKWSHVQKTLHSWDFCLIVVFLTTVNTSDVQKDCTDFIISW